MGKEQGLSEEIDNLIKNGTPEANKTTERKGDDVIEVEAEEITTQENNSANNNPEAENFATRFYRTRKQGCV